VWTLGHRLKTGPKRPRDYHFYPSPMLPILPCRPGERHGGQGGGDFRHRRCHPHVRMPVRRAHLDRLGRLAAIAIDNALAASGGPSGLKQKSFTGLSSPLNLFCGRADTHLRSPKPRKPTLKAPLPPRRGFRFCRGLRIDCVVHSPSRRMAPDGGSRINLHRGHQA
jgi:hypothetical protein